jgi:hypothetical protein
MFCIVFVLSIHRKQKAADEEAKKGQIQFQKPFLSVITVSKCLMIVSATFFGRNDAAVTVVSQLLIMAALGAITFWWMQLRGAEFERTRIGWAEPCYPPAINVWRGYSFFGGVLGAVIAILALRATDTFNGNTGLAILAGAMVMLALPLIVWYKKWENDNAHMWAPVSPGLFCFLRCCVVAIG